MKIISGGQTGADRTALEVARELGIETGGVAPQGWRTDDGPDPSLASFGLVQSLLSSSTLCTWANVQAAEGTVIFGNAKSPGSRYTIKACEDFKRPYLINPTIDELVAWMREHEITILNVAGNRRRVNPAVVAQVRAVLKPALELQLMYI